MAHLQILDTHHRVVLADRGRGLVQVVAADIADLLVALRDFDFCKASALLNTNRHHPAKRRMRRCCSPLGCGWKIEEGPVRRTVINDNARDG